MIMPWHRWEVITTWAMCVIASVTSRRTAVVDGWNEVSQATIRIRRVRVMRSKWHQTRSFPIPQRHQKKSWWEGVTYVVKHGSWEKHVTWQSDFLTFPLTTSTFFRHYLQRETQRVRFTSIQLSLGSSYLVPAMTENPDLSHTSPADDSDAALSPPVDPEPIPGLHGVPVRCKSSFPIPYN